MKITKRRVVSVDDVTAQLDTLAHQCGIVAPRYDEAEAQSMSEFDALEWICLCSQRIALQQRERETASRGKEVPTVPSILQGIYGTKHFPESKKLENTDDGQLSLAA